MSADTKAFISHASEDEHKALELKSRLADEGIECWCFEEDLRYSEDIELRVKEAIEDSDWLIVMLTDHAQNSDWIRWELGFAKELHDSRRGVERPIILAVHDYDAFPSPCEMQPLRFGSNEPLGPVLTFDRHRCYRLRDSAMIPILSRTMKPEITRITDPCDRHARLFRGVESLTKELFPNDLDRPDIDEIREWLENDLHRPDAQEWHDLLLAAHLGQSVTGYLYLDYSVAHDVAYGPFLGISKAWRKRTTMRHLFAHARERLIEVHPRCRGVLFQVEPTEDDWHQTDAGTDVSFPASHVDVERLRRVNLFQTFGALTLCRPEGTPIRVRQPSLRSPPCESTEVEHFIMLLPLQPGESFAFGDELIGTYLSLFRSGFGPEGVNVAGYLPYLEEFERRLRASLPPAPRFEKLYFTRAMREAMRRRDGGTPAS